MPVSAEYFRTSAAYLFFQMTSEATPSIIPMKIPRNERPT
jgi:hypothetical protein